GNRVKLFDWAGEQFTDTQAVLGHRWPVAAAVYSPDGKYLATADLTGFKLWDAQTLKELGAVEAQAQQLAFAPDSRTLIAATTTDQHKAVHTFHRWDVGTQEEMPALT